MLINNHLLTNIDNRIRLIERQYKKIQGLILTEDDLKCLIFSSLRSMIANNQSPYFGRKVTLKNPNIPHKTDMTQDESITATPVHSEIPWYDERGKLAIKPDISIIEPRSLSILHGVDSVHLPSKQFEFGGQSIIFEIKFCRQRSGITPNFLTLIKQDYIKVNRLYDRLCEQGKQNDLYCFFVIFNKTDTMCEEARRYLVEQREGSYWRTVYGTSNVEF